MALSPTQRRAVIADWRGLSETPARPERCRSSAELIPALMKKLGLNERLQENEVMRAWSQVVGEFIGAHSTPSALRDGVLYVRVLQPALHYELEQVSKAQILRKLKQRFGAKVIQTIKFRLG